MLTKEECLKSLCRIQCGARKDKKCEYCDCFDNKVNIWKCVENTKESLILRELIGEYFDNPPLKFEELKHNMWVWDKKYEMWNCILAKRINCAGEQEIEFKYFLEREEELYNDIFENDRFYEKQVKNDVEL